MRLLLAVLVFATAKAPAAENPVDVFARQSEARMRVVIRRSIGPTLRFGFMHQITKTPTGFHDSFFSDGVIDDTRFTCWARASADESGAITSFVPARSQFCSLKIED